MRGYGWEVAGSCKGWRLRQEEIEHQRKMKELEAALERTKQWKSLSLGARDPQQER
jgi:hypothetical protein